MSTVTLSMNKARKRTREEKAQTHARYKEIIGIVKKYDIKDGLTPEQTVELIQDLGTTFIKLGQIASTHPDVLPQEYCDALSKLRTKARPLAIEEVKAQIESELGKPTEELFKEFDEKPLGSASIAQVHRAVLPTGEVVAVKVQRPGVVEKVTNDLAILEHLVEIYDFINKDEGGMSLKELVAELVKTSTEELDFTNEENNLIRFSANNEGREGIKSPKCYSDYSTTAILTEDFFSSPAVEDIDSLGKTDEDREKLAYLIAHNYMQQVMEDGFYHADPHAGNIMLPEDGGIEWIDFGMMGTVTPTQRDVLKNIVLALVQGNTYRFKNAVLKIVTSDEPIDHAQLLEMCESVTEQFIDTDLAAFDTSVLVDSLTSSVEGAGLKIDPFLANLGRGLVTLEGTIHLISPKLNIMTVLVDYLKSSFDPKGMERSAMNALGRAADSADAMIGLPSKVEQTLDMLQKGHVKIGTQVAPSDQLSRDIRAGAGLIAIALIAMAFVLGACMLGSSTTSLLLGGIPAIGIVGLVVGIAIAIYVFVKIRPYLKK